MTIEIGKIFYISLLCVHLSSFFIYDVRNYSHGIEGTTKESSLNDLDARIASINQEIINIETLLKTELNSADISYLREEKKQLREEKKQLREERNQLRAEKFKLARLSHTGLQENNSCYCSTVNLIFCAYSDAQLQLIAEIRDIAAEVKELKKQRINSIGVNAGRPTGACTRSEWIQTLDANQLRINLRMFDNCRAPTADECTHMELPEDTLYTLTKVKGAHNDSRIIDTCELFRRQVATWRMDEIQMDTNSKHCPSIGSHKPDVLHRKRGRHGEQSICMVGEIKGMVSGDETAGDFSFEEIGQICDILQTALLVQPWRHFIYGYLTDCRRFEFFKASRLPSNEVVFERSGILMDFDGWAAFRMLCVQSESSLGFRDVSIKGWELQNWLGSGLTSAVFTATRTGGKSSSEEGDDASESVVCKLFLDRHSDGSNATHSRALRKREVRALRLLQDIDNVPKIVPNAPKKTACGLYVLLKSPVGMEIPSAVRLPISAYAPVVSTLKIAHERDVYHNDISPSNMFAVVPMLSVSASSSSSSSAAAAKVLLNDFGSASTLDEIRQGCKVGTRELYYELSPVACFGAAADLCALVRSVFVLTQYTFDPASVSTCHELDEIMVQQLVFWESALAYARGCDYQMLENLLKYGGRSMT